MARELEQPAAERDAETQVESFAVLTFGCRTNQADSFALERELLAGGALPVPAERADLVIVNTCSVTAAADQAARQAIRRIARDNPAARIVVTGCYATRRPSDLAALPNVLRVVSNAAKGELAGCINHCQGRSTDRAQVWGEAPASPVAREPGRLREGDGEPRRSANAEAGGSRHTREIASISRSSGALPAPTAPRPGYGGRTVAPLRIQTGCDERCSYCSIPSTRGPSRSLPLDAVVAEARGLASAGYKEITLTGVHLGAYGRDLAPPSSLRAVLEALDRQPGDVTYRLSSLEPMDCSPAVVALVAASRRFAPHFHLPLQHASDRVLAAMRRPYVLDDYRRVIASIRADLPDAFVGSDVIVGFPGETSADHDLLAAFLESSDISHLHVFPFSPRPGTDAEHLGPRVPAAVVRQRCDELRAIAAGLRGKFAEGQVGRIRRALTIEDGARAVTDNYLKVRIGPGRPRNERVLVRLTSAEPLLAEVVA